jgi:hypothetical protein
MLLNRNIGQFGPVPRILLDNVNSNVQYRYASHLNVRLSSRLNVRFRSL